MFAKFDIGFLGEGAGDPDLAALLPGFPLQPGDRLVHSAWERGKTQLGSAIEGRGYLRARRTKAQVEVHREDRAADIELAWDTGPRYRYGATVFEGSQFDDDFMQRFVRHRPGQPYLADDLLGLQRRLIDADYFAFVSVSPRIARRRGIAGEPAAARADAGGSADAVVAADVAPDDDDGEPGDAEGAEEDRAPSVPIVVEVTPAPRHVFTGGVSIGTDSGLGVRGSVLRRWVNRRGHRVSAEAELSQRRTAAAANYAMPRPGEGMRTLNVGISHLREETDTSESDTTSLYAMENRLWRGWLRDLGLRAMYGDFEVADQRRTSTLVFAEGRLSRRVADDDLFPTRGWSLALEARAGSDALLSDTDFVQLRAEARLIHPLGERQRLHLRGQLRRHLGRRLRCPAAASAVLRRRRPHRARLRLPDPGAGGRPGPRAGRRASGRGQRRVRTRCRARLGDRRLRGLRQRLHPGPLPDPHRHRCRRALALAGRHGAPGRRARPRRCRPRRHLAPRDRAGAVRRRWLRWLVVGLAALLLALVLLVAWLGGTGSGLRFVLGRTAILLDDNLRWRSAQGSLSAACAWRVSSTRIRPWAGCGPMSWRSARAAGAC